ncbi:MAG: RnfABCDGE type electron transport complex subunit C [Candidatus Ornithospirochaeta sp.]|nr:RnfABCDGE type electron transport complex subunit C [Sphaerochaetaceae bacterium]MDY5523900.1 RnfABCDGE type electron transport complex subunit C [Candidatus Ornithospirochaeta sp.]
MLFKKKISAVHVPHCKSTQDMHSVRIAPPDSVTIPMSMHSGVPAVPVVQKGDHVYIGQLIAKEGEGRVSSPIHASVSGTVSEVSEKSISIKSDGKMEKDPEMKAPKLDTLDDFLDGCRKSGIVGLGGAAYPLHGKWEAVRKNKIDTVLINGAECEPYCTADNRTMVEDADHIKSGIEILKKFVGAKEYIIGIEANKPEAISHLTEVFKDDSSVEVKTLESVYPQGAKQVLLWNATGKVVAAGQRLASLGVIITNVTTLAKMALYFETGMPLVDKCVSVDGSAVKNPSNIIVPIGTSFGYCLEACGGFKEEPRKVIEGGPMMGRTVASLDEPVVKATNGIVAMSEKEAILSEPSPCIHCGRCVEACPLNLNPVAFAKALSMEDEDEKEALLKREDVAQCMECGCCAFVCPAHRPLVANNREDKRFMRSRRR